MFLRPSFPPLRIFSPLAIALLVSYSPGSEARDSSTCTPIFAGPSSRKIETNRNGAIPTDHYRQTNSRTYFDYEVHFGELFSTLFPLHSWLDSGSGFALAPIYAVLEGYAQRAVAINAQESLGPIRRGDYEWLERTGSSRRLAQIASLASEDDFEMAMTDVEQRRFKPNALETLIAAAAMRLASVEESGAFRYIVGYSEKSLTKLDERFDLITDLFGAYFYSAERIQVLNEYYRHLIPGGRSLVAYRAVDITRVPIGNLKGTERIITEYGPTNLVQLKDGTRQTLEEFLERNYPTVFSLHTANARMSKPTFHHRVLMIRRDPRIADLHLERRIEMVSHTFGDGGIAAQIPNANFRER